MDQDAPDLSITPVPPRVDLPSHDEYFSRNNLRLHEISTLLIQDRDVASLYDRILNAAIDLMSSDMASMQVFHPGRNRLELAVWKGFHPASAAHWKWVSLDSSCSCGVALKAGCRIVVPDTETCEFMAGTAELDEYRRSGIRAVQSTPLMSRTGELLGMISTHWRTPHRPTEYALRTLDVVARQVADLIERTKIENELRKTSERFRWLASIVESSDDAIIGSNLEGAITSWNKGAERLFGYTAGEALGAPYTFLISSDRQAETRDIIDRIVRGENIANFETARQTKDGRTIAVSMTISPVKNLENAIIGTSEILRDITEQKLAEERIALLGREAEHRTKNILAVVQAMIALSRSDTPDGLKKALEGRIQALANAHALLVHSRWLGAELSALAAQELAPYLNDRTRARIDGPRVLLEPNTAQAIAVILHELTTNAVKYGALSVRDGHVHLHWSHAENGPLTIRWTETGGPRVEISKHDGVGTRVMDHTVRGLLNGQMHIDWLVQGIRCELTIKI